MTGGVDQLQGQENYRNYPGEQPNAQGFMQSYGEDYY
jgi:hypothetical protein